MLRLHSLLAAVLLVVAVPGAWAQSPDLPPGPLQQKARTACMECHDAGIIVQQRLDKKAWSKEVDKMIRWGALVEAQDRDPLVDYFAANFMADKPAALPEYKSQNSVGKKTGKRDKRD